MNNVLEPGSTFAGYTIERVLGRGGMGTVYLAQHPTLRRKVALKLLDSSWVDDDYVRSRFESEADHVAQLEHSNIVTVYDRGRIGNRLWISMQYVPGIDARAAVSAGPIDIVRAVHIVTETGRALDYAHRAGILHRDVKPANILLAPGEPERVLLTDFGTAKAFDETHHLTKTGMLVATLHYAAPEQITGEELDERVDIYALGCTLYHLLTGEPPYQGTAASTVMHGHLNGAIPRPSTRRGDLPGDFDIVIAKALAKHRENRYPTCQALSDDAGIAQRATPDVETRPAHPAPGAEHMFTRSPGPGPSDDVDHLARTDSTGWWRRRSSVLAALLVVVISAATTAYLVWPSPQDTNQMVVPFSDLSDPFGVAVDADGHVYVSDYQRDQVLRYDADTHTTTTLPFTGLSRPMGIAINAEGTLYVADSANNRVVALESGSDQQRELPFTDLNVPIAVAVHGYGDLYVADALNNRVVVLPHASNTPTDLPFPVVIGPYSVAANDQGDVYVTTANSQVSVLRSATNTVSVLPFDNLDGADGIAVGPDDAVYVSDNQNDRVVMLPAGSQEQTVLPFTGLSAPVGIAIGNGGEVYVVDGDNKRVVTLPTT
ncbi:serine/threonine-protein kinase PknD [Rhodococcus sp. IEGM 1351]|uniref:serine/threonine-protein kinase PknD n=1 Tax=Rhodococcus sp. IEGM 1351 TaxID=3047089 RepID=UPI0022F33BA6|nr:MULTISPECIES: serine/threonine-protein kinase PknD [Rhodococcus]MDI9939165.1 serine/threonine-protein kinase PknD [Rhodococcus sp. IEGM 1351]GLK39049.1 hypothetical protein GCM10017611_59190 [Rhodococcus wratislaviensis]